MPSSQKNVCVNPALGCVFFEGKNLVYNYRTDQWTRIPAHAGLRYFDITDDNALIGLLYVGADLYSVADGSTGDNVTATITTGEVDFGARRSMVTGVRPLVDGGTWTVEIDSRNDLSTTVSTTTGTSINSRTKFSNMRAENRYHRIRFENSDGFTTALGADVEFAETGEI